MKKTYFLNFLTLTLLLVACQSKELNQVNGLTEKERVSFTKKIIRFIGKKPEEATHENKFHSYFDNHYTNQASLHDLEFYHLDNSGKIFFIFTRNAPSLTLKKVGIGGYVKFDEKGDVSEFEEVFRTWKKKPEELKELNQTLFEKLIRQDDLSPFYTENSNGKEFIEFPNKDVKYNKETRKWESSLRDPIEEMLQHKQQEMKLKLEKLDQKQTAQ